MALLAGCDSSKGGITAPSGSGGSGTNIIGTGGSGTGGSGTGGLGTGGSGTGGATNRATDGSVTGGTTAVTGTGGKGTGGSSGAGAGGSVTGGTTTATGTGGKGSGGASSAVLGTGGAGTGGAGTGGLMGTGGAVGGAGTGGLMGTGGAVGGAGSTGTSSAACLNAITNYASDGPFSYTTKTSGNIKMWIPKVPSGCRVPMVHYSNGTGATCSFYSASLVRLVSNGFLTLCYEDTNTGAGKFGIEAFKTALSQYPDLADYKFGSTGHSQGGMASLVTLQYAETEWGDKGTYAGLAIEPASGFGQTPSESWETIYAKIKSPTFMFSGLVTDTLVSQSWVQQAFDAMNKSTEVYFWAKSGANHITTVNQDAEEVLISWFRWKLLGDQKACQYWKALPTTDMTWTVVDKQNEVACK